MPNPFKDANRYPDFSVEQLTKRLAKMHNVSTEQIIVGCGSTEILKLAVSAFTGPGKKLVMASPTFEAVGFYANATKAEVVKIPLAASYAHSLVAMGIEAQKDPGLVYICNPNNPTGSVTPRRSLENFIRELPKNCYVLMDEAYHDFVTVSADYASFIEHSVNDDRVIVALPCEWRAPVHYRQRRGSSSWVASFTDFHVSMRRPEQGGGWKRIFYWLARKCIRFSNEVNRS
jgi:histidinol-phosphate/aromatic aminotransferase/cobyric acid decarboxylase-like protein